MKKYIEDQTISLFIAEDGYFHLITEDSDEAIREYAVAVTAYHTAKMNADLSKGFSKENFVEVTAEVETEEEDPIEYAHSDVQTLDMQKMENDFKHIKWLAFQKADMPKYTEQHDIKAYQNMLQAYNLYLQKIYDKEQSQRNTKIIFNAYVTERKERESVKKMHFLQQKAIKETNADLTDLKNSADKMSKDKIIDKLLDIVSLAIGQEFTSNQIRDRMKGETKIEG